MCVCIYIYKILLVTDTRVSRSTDTNAWAQSCKTCHVTGTRIRVYLSVSSLKQDGWLANGNHG